MHAILFLQTVPWLKWVGGEEVVELLVRLTGLVGCNRVVSC